jgi:hypothetical protein
VSVNTSEEGNHDGGRDQAQVRRRNPGKRDELERLSGQRKYPVIEFSDGRIYREESKEMAARIRAGNLPDVAGEADPEPPR